MSYTNEDHNCMHEYGCLQDASGFPMCILCGFVDKSVDMIGKTHICGDPNDTCDQDCVEIAYLAKDREISKPPKIEEVWK